MIVYVITNILNGKQYVGQTHGTLEQRFNRHGWSSAHKCMPVVKAIKKYGKESFTIDKLCECESQEDLDRMEVYWVEKLKTFVPNGYNLKAGQGRGLLSEEVKKKISNANKGRVFSEEHIINLSKSHKNWIPSEETRQKWRDAFSGKKQRPEDVRKRVESLKREYVLLSPNAELFTTNNMKSFCKEHRLSPTKMSEVVNGKRQQHKGWKLKTI